MRYGKAIRTLRNLKGMTQIQLADALCCDVSYISLIENDRRGPSFDFLQKVAWGLKIPLYLIILQATEEHELFGMVTPEERDKILSPLVKLLRSELIPSLPDGWEFEQESEENSD